MDLGGAGRVSSFEVLLEDMTEVSKSGAGAYALGDATLVWRVAWLQQPVVLPLVEQTADGPPDVEPPAADTAEVEPVWVQLQDKACAVKLVCTEIRDVSPRCAVPSSLWDRLAAAADGLALIARTQAEEQRSAYARGNGAPTWGPIWDVIAELHNAVGGLRNLLPGDFPKHRFGGDKMKQILACMLKMYPVITKLAETVNNVSPPFHASMWACLCKNLLLPNGGARAMGR